MATKRVAIACQGGGTHAAFTWGVLTRILETKKTWDAAADGGDTFEIIGISGTSAGALCALATWYGLVPNTGDPACGTLDKAIERLNHLWTVFGASTPIETAHNMVVSALLNMKEKGAPFPASNPYGMFGELAVTGLSILGARQQYVSFPGLLASVCPHFDQVDWPGLAKKNFRMVAGAIEVISGNFEVFDSDKSLEDMGLRSSPKEFDQYNTTRWRMRRALSLEGVAASGTLPEILRAQKIENTRFPSCTPGRTVTRPGFYWDGLYSQNPPVRAFVQANSREEKPDEIWVIRINPQEIDPRQSPPDLAEIRDRENDLAGNLSLNAELDHILEVNNWLANYGADDPALKNERIVQVRTIKMTQETAWGLTHTSKFDRNPGHLASLRREGDAVAAEWLHGWRTRKDDFDSYPNDARYPETN